MKQFIHETNTYPNGKVEDTGWWEISGNKVINENGGWHDFYKDENSQIVEAESFDDLYKKLGKDYFSYLIKKDSLYGWLSPSGEWFPCSYADHKDLAELYLGMNEKLLETSGWAKVTADYNKESLIIANNILTEQQQIKLNSLGISL